MAQFPVVDGFKEGSRRHRHTHTYISMRALWSDRHAAAAAAAAAPSMSPKSDCIRLRCFGGAPSTVKHFRSEIRNKSGNTPETLSEQILNFQVSYGWSSRNPENKGDSLPRLISELCYPQHNWYPSFFWKGPFHGAARAGHEIPSSTGGTSECWLPSDSRRTSSAARISLDRTG